MTKRDLIKWVQSQREKAVKEVDKAYDEARGKLLQNYREQVKLEQCADELEPLLADIMVSLDNFKSRVQSIEGASFSIYSWNGFYRKIYEMTDRTKLIEELCESASFNRVLEFREKLEDLRQECSKVSATYYTVIETLKNMCSAKVGIEYLEKLGFDISSIQPQKKAQLPATVEVNVDTKYLLIPRNGKDNTDE